MSAKLKVCFQYSLRTKTKRLSKPNINRKLEERVNMNNRFNLNLEGFSNYSNRRRKESKCLKVC